MSERSKVSQAVFTAYLNTSPSTVQKWEIGEKKPSGSALKLLNLIEQSALRADSENTSPFLRDRLVAPLMHTCRV